ncbi:MAG: GNAT family N-acetyltransferase, partial [Polyangiaceae bacterium]
GFALVHRGSRLSGAEDVWDMAEFFVLRKHRRTGIGSEVARQIFREHEGKWEVRQRRANAAATAFWRKAIGSFATAGYTELEIDDARWCGPVQCFTS